MGKIPSGRLFTAGFDSSKWRFEESIAAYRRAELTGRCPGALQHRSGAGGAGAQLPEQVIQQYRAVIGLEPTPTDAYNNLGNLAGRAQPQERNRWYEAEVCRSRRRQHCTTTWDTPSSKDRYHEPVAEAAWLKQVLHDSTISAANNLADLGNVVLIGRGRRLLLASL